MSAAAWGREIHPPQGNKSCLDKAPAQHFGCPKEGDSPGHALLPLHCEALATWAAQNNLVSPSRSDSCESAACQTLAEPSLLICLSFSFSPDANAVSSGPTRSVMGQLLLESLLFPGRAPSRDGHWGDLVGLGWCPLGECLVPRGGTRALLGGRPARRMQLNGLHEQLCSTDGAFPLCAAPGGTELPPPSLLFPCPPGSNWGSPTRASAGVGGLVVPLLHGQLMAAQVPWAFWGEQFAASDLLTSASLSTGVPPRRWRPRSLVSPCFFSSWQWDGEAGWTQPGHCLLGAVSS